jgi:hypothetical protein
MLDLTLPSPNQEREKERREEGLKPLFSTFPLFL